MVFISLFSCLSGILKRFSIAYLRGQDSTVFVVVEKPFSNNDYFVVYIREFKTNLMDEVNNYIKFLDRSFHFDHIYMDTTGLGSGPYDFLVKDMSFKHRTAECKFTNKSKEEMYTNLKMLLERRSKNKPNGLHLPNHKKLLYELIDMKYEISDNGNIKIHHSARGHDDFADALALACLHFKPDKQQDGSFGVA